MEFELKGYRFSDYCVCPECCGELIEGKGFLACKKCEIEYEVQNGIPVLLPKYEEGVRKDYVKSYEEMANEDLEKEIENLRQYRHIVLSDFIGNTKGKRILDIGSSHGLYLQQLDSDFKVAFDISLNYLIAIPNSNSIVPICGDAEKLPFKPDFFDIIIVSDILEHLLEPKNLIQRITTICDSNTRIIVHVPWEETLEAYLQSRYKFTHQRSFNAFNYAELWVDFYVKKMKKTYPNLKYPFIFRLEGRIPLFIYNRLVERYFFKEGVAKKDFEWRTVRSSRLPKGERWLLCLFKPVFKIFEMRLRNLRSRN